MSARSRAPAPRPGAAYAVYGARFPLIGWNGLSGTAATIGEIVGQSNRAARIWRLPDLQPERLRAALIGSMPIRSADGRLAGPPCWADSA
ncbi:hypothetical protein FRAHR75_480026 [Frankia sp. Hr75.2]|nr:hypothetical protein FRAHR75_480026 [Frankia sp. Hr75.2]